MSVTCEEWLIWAKNGRCDKCTKECASACFECGMLQQESENEKLRAEVAELKTIFIEAQKLIHSGYDGPFMGEAVADLIRAVMVVEKK